MKESDCISCRNLSTRQAFGKVYLYCTESRTSIANVPQCYFHKLITSPLIEITDIDELNICSYSERLAIGFNFNNRED